MAQGKYIWIAESDDYADERLLESLVCVLESDPAIAFAYCRSWNVTEAGRVNGFVRLLPGVSGRSAVEGSDGDQECRNYFVICNTISNASVVVFRRDSYDEVGGADETLRACGDWKLWAARR
jgi:hypothetical protein